MHWKIELFTLFEIFIFEYWSMSSFGDSYNGLDWPLGGGGGSVTRKTGKSTYVWTQTFEKKNWTVHHLDLINKHECLA